ncbi:MAG: TIR domain-containing protein [Caldilinea sp.]
MSRVFISYRRADSAPWAHRLSDHLGLRFGKDLVFQDVDDIKPGADWLATIRQALAACQVFLILIGRQWLVDSQGRHRLSDPDDVLREEITQALASNGAAIPVLVDGAAMPAATDLPTPLQPLTRRQAMVLSDTTWIGDVERLIERLAELVLPSVEQIPLRVAQRELFEKQERYFDLLKPSPAEALELAQKAQGYLDRVLPLYPQDPYLKVARGYMFKNEGMALARLGRHDESHDALDQGKRIFRTMIAERPLDESAWNGLGSIAAVRGDLAEALRYIDRALEINPGYTYAQQDRQTVQQAMADRA